MTLLGVYGENDPQQILDFEAWLGRKVDMITGFVGQVSWADFTGSAQWAAGVWSAIDRPVYWTVPLVVNGTTLEQAATGAFDGYYRTVAQALAASRPQDAEINVRVGWEMTGNWYPWSAIGHEQAYVDAFRQFVDTFRSVDSRFKFDWNIAATDVMDPAAAYPGDAYVDTISEDFYWDINAGDSTDPATAWAWEVNRPHGLAWIEQFAAAHGKPTAYPEWGIMSDNAGPYIQQVKAWFDSHNVKYEGYWNSDAAYPGKLSDGTQPNAGAVFRQLFSGPDLTTGGGGGTVADTTPAMQFGKPGTWGQTADVWEGHASFGGQDYHTFGGNLPWGGVLTAQSAPTSWAATNATHLAFDTIEQMSLDLHAAGKTGLDLMVITAKYGSIITGDGNDTITWVAHSDAAGANNTMTIRTGAGNDTVHVTAVGLSPLAAADATGNGSLYNPAYNGRYSTADIYPGAGTDSVTVEGSVRLVLHAGTGSVAARGGAASDTFYVGKGAADLTGGAGNDLFVLAAGDGHATIEDFTSGKDHLKFVGLHVTDVTTKAATQNGVTGLLVTYDAAHDSVFLAHVTKLATADSVFA